jgi:hypothetical protein
LKDHLSIHESSAALCTIYPSTREANAFKPQQCLWRGCFLFHRDDMNNLMYHQASRGTSITGRQKYRMAIFGRICKLLCATECVIVACRVSSLTSRGRKCMLLAQLYIVKRGAPQISGTYNYRELIRNYF